MKKSLIALAVLGATAGVAYAQSNVTIYGIIDTGFIKKSGHDVEMGENVNNRLGFRGVEDLGNGQKATFEVEERFNLYDGTNKGAGKAYNGKDRTFDGLANVGLKGGWGGVKLGRVNELTTETIRKFDPFYQYGVGSMMYGSQRVRGIDNTIRYDSPNWAGFNFGLSYSLGQNTDKRSAGSGGLMEEKLNNGHGVDNDGYGVMLQYDNGALALAANWSRLADSDRSSVWNVAAAYRFGDVKIEALYQQTKDKGWAQGSKSAWKSASIGEYGSKVTTAYANVNDIKEQQALLGLEWKLGPGRLNASAQWLQVQANGGTEHISDADIYKYAIGYTYDLSKRTAIYGNVAYTDYDNKEVAAVYGDADDGVWGVQIGITHKF